MNIVTRSNPIPTTPVVRLRQQDQYSPFWKSLWASLKSNTFPTTGIIYFAILPTLEATFSTLLLMESPDLAASYKLTHWNAPHIACDHVNNLRHRGFCAKDLSHLCKGHTVLIIALNSSGLLLATSSILLIPVTLIP